MQKVRYSLSVNRLNIKFQILLIAPGGSQKENRSNCKLI